MKIKGNIFDTNLIIKIPIKNKITKTDIKLEKSNRCLKFSYYLKPELKLEKLRRILNFVNEMTDGKFEFFLTDKEFLNKNEEF